jgi:endonuclease YncB( thermonuclease family)
MTSANRYALGVLGALSLLAAGATPDCARADGTFFKHKPPAIASPQHAAGTPAVARVSRPEAAAGGPGSSRSDASRAGTAREASARTAAPAEVTGIVSQVVSTDTLIVAGQRVRLEGLLGSQAMAAPLRQWLARQGGRLRCRLLAAGYRCLTPAGQDVGLVVILVGAAECAAGAPSEYRMAQMQARQARRGLWARR